MTDIILLVQSAVPWALFIFVILGATVCLMQKDLLKMAILTSVEGFAVAAIFQILLAPDVALTQAVVGAGIIPTFVALSILKTRKEPISREEGDS